MVKAFVLDDVEAFVFWLLDLLWIWYCMHNMTRIRLSGQFSDFNTPSPDTFVFNGGGCKASIVSEASVGTSI